MPASPFTSSPFDTPAPPPIRPARSRSSSVNKEVPKKIARLIEDLHSTPEPIQPDPAEQGWNLVVGFDTDACIAIELKLDKGKNRAVWLQS